MSPPTTITTPSVLSGPFCRFHPEAHHVPLTAKQNRLCECKVRRRQMRLWPLGSLPLRAVHQPACSNFSCRAVSSIVMTAIFTPLKGICGCQKGRFREGADSHSERRVKTHKDTLTHCFYTVKKNIHVQSFPSLRNLELGCAVTNHLSLVIKDNSHHNS